MIYNKTNNKKTTSLVKELTNKQVVSISTILLIIILFYSFATIGLEKRQLEKKVGDSIDYLVDILSTPLWGIQEQSINQIGETYFQDPSVLLMKITNLPGNEVILSLRRNSSFPRITAQSDIYYNNRIVGKIEFSYSKKASVIKIINFLFFEILVGIFIFIYFYIINKKLIGSCIKSPLVQMTQFINSYSHGSFNENFPKLTFEEFQPFIEVLDEMKVEIAREATELKKSNEALQKNEENLKTTLDSIGDGVIATDIHGKITSMNHVAERLTGYSLKNVNGKQLDDIFHIINSLSEERILNTAMKVITGDKKIERKNNLTLISLDGSRYQISYSASPIRTNRGRIVGVVQVFSDVTEEQALREQFDHKNRMDAIGQLAGGMAHDFNNLLGGIMSSAQLLMSPKRNLDEKAMQYVGIIMQASERAADLTSKLLTFGRKGKQVSTAVDLHKVIDETVSMIKRTIDKRITIVVEKTAKNYTVIGDSTELQNAFLNLCINSSQALPAGGKIQINSKNIPVSKSLCNASTFDIEPGEYCEIEVLDDGIGIASDNLKKIFEPFYTTKEQGRGTGLGLSAVFGAVQDFHGAITVCSEVGSGTSFNIILPCSDEKPIAEKKQEQILSGSGTILIVDDEELIRLTGKEMLESMGYKVMLAENGQEAIDLFTINHSNIDLVLMDMIMPVMNGREAFKKMRSIDGICKVIISSGFTRDENLNELKNEGLAGFIRKPYRDYELSQLLSEALKT